MTTSLGTRLSVAFADSSWSAAGGNGEPVWDWPKTIVAVSTRPSAGISDAAGAPPPDGDVGAACRASHPASTATARSRPTRVVSGDRVF
jgi:hypothetical protein